MEKRELSWNDVERLAKQLAEKITASGFRPDCIIGITVGGLIPLALIAKALDVRTVLTASAQSYEGETRGTLKVTYIPQVDLSGKAVLLVDEIAETGSTLTKVAEQLRAECQPSVLKTATLCMNPSICVAPPDFYVMEDARWVVFPWE